MTETAILDQPIEGVKTGVAEASGLAEEFVSKVQANLDLALQIPQKARSVWEDLQRLTKEGQPERAGVMGRVFFNHLVFSLNVVRHVQLQADQALVLAGKP